MPELKGSTEEKIEIIKNSINNMIIERNETNIKFAKKSEFWTSSTNIEEGFKNFTNHFNVKDINKIRYQTAYLTGLEVINEDIFKNETRWIELNNYYTSGIPEKFHIYEPPIKEDNCENKKYVNGDTVRYQSCITNLYLQGIFDSLKKYIIMEIGSGTGGLAYAFEQCKIDFNYILIDIPEILQMASAYLLVNSKKNIYIYDKNTFTKEFIKNNMKKYDFVLLPNYILDLLKEMEGIDIFINLASFQEMTELQIKTYLDFAKEKLTGFIYSENVDRHSGNNEIVTSVRQLLSERFRLYPDVNHYRTLIVGSTFGNQFIGVQLNNDFKFKEFRINKE